MKPQNIPTILRLLKKLYPSVGTALLHTSPWELLVATILSAQCTDVLVNKVTPDLFKRYPTITTFADVDVVELTDALKRVTFFRNKAKFIKATAEKILVNFGGKVPQTMAELITLSGVARKTANVVLHDAFQVNEGVVVDTHIFRLSHRLGFSTKQTPEGVEQDLMAIVAKKSWGWIAHALIWHGRKICKARNPLCSQCILSKQCPSNLIKTSKDVTKKRNTPVKK